MIFDSAPTEPEISRDIFARLPSQDQIHDLALSRSKNIKTGAGLLAALGTLVEASRKSLKDFAWIRGSVHKIVNGDNWQIHLNGCVSGPDQHVKTGGSTAPYPL